MSRTRWGISFVATIASLGVLMGACSTPPVTQTPVAIKPIYVADLVADRPGYQGITPGTSSRHDVLEKWGDPNVTRTHAEFESLHYFDRASQQVFFLIKDDVVSHPRICTCWSRKASASGGRNSGATRASTRRVSIALQVAGL